MPAKKTTPGQAEKRQRGLDPASSLPRFMIGGVEAVAIEAFLERFKKVKDPQHQRLLQLLIGREIASCKIVPPKIVKEKDSDE